MQRKFIPQIEKTLDPKILGWFFIENDWGEREAFVGIPGVDGIARLYAHEIDRNGGVTPSVRVGTFDENLTLSGWPVGISKPAGVQFIPAA